MPHSAQSALCATADAHEMDGVHMTTTILGTFIGAVTLTGSAVAFGKLHGLLNSKPLNIWGALMV